MASNRYSLANYFVVIEIPQTLARNLFVNSSVNTLIIGGRGSYLDSITVDTTNDMWTTKGDSTGSWVHERNLDLTGSCNISLNQLSEAATRLKQLSNLYRRSNTEYDGLTMEVQDNEGHTIVKMTDCFIKKIPQHQFQSSAQSLDWVFTCGQVIYED